MGKKSDRIEELMAELHDATAELMATRFLLRGMGDMVGAEIEAPSSMEVAQRCLIEFGDALQRRWSTGVPPLIPGLRMRPPAPSRTASPTKTSAKVADMPWHTFDEEVDEQIDRLDEQGLTKPRENGAMTVVASTTDEDEADGAIQTIDDLARELGIQPRDTPMATLAAAHQEVLRIKNIGSDVQASSSNKALTKGDSLAESVAHGHAQNAELRDGVTQARTIVNRIAAVMQIGAWDKDGTELLERVQQYENWKHDLKRRIRELQVAPIPVDAIRDEVSVNGHVADELQSHLARLMAPKELADWLKSRPRDSVVKAASPVHLPYPFTFKQTDIHCLRVATRDAGLESRVESLTIRLEGLSTMLHELAASNTAADELTRLMNVVILPILARQRSAQRIPEDTDPPPPAAA